MTLNLIVLAVAARLAAAQVCLLSCDKGYMDDDEEYVANQEHTFFRTRGGVPGPLTSCSLWLPVSVALVIK
jgi:hypothetical protein